MIRPPLNSPLFFFNDTATTEIYTLSLHDALPISRSESFAIPTRAPARDRNRARKNSWPLLRAKRPPVQRTDRKSIRLNSSHDQISYAVFCLKKKKNNTNTHYYVY